MRMEEREGKEEDEVVEWQRWERRVRRCSYKDTLSTFCIQGFLGNRTMLICTLLNSPKRRGGRYLGFRATTTHIAHLSPQVVTAHRIFANFSAICYGSVITIVQPLLWFFLRDLFSLRFPLVARGLRHHYVSVPHCSGDFFFG